MNTLTPTKQKAIKISESFFLQNQKTSLPEVEAPSKKETATHHILWIDCSGSMSGVLRLIRTHLKNKLVSLVKPIDKVSIGWFSSRGEYGLLKENVNLTNLPELNELHKAIDRFLQPVGLTGFKEPLQKTNELINQFKKDSSNYAYSFFFLTDGYDNQWSKSDILNICQDLKTVCDSNVIVEYGYYCDHEFLVKMSEVLGGTLIFAENFEEFEPVIESSLSKTVSSGKVTIDLENTPLYNLVWAYDNGNLVNFQAENNSILISKDIKDIYYFTDNSDYHTESPHKGGVDLESIRPLYAGMGLLSQRMKSNEVFNILKALGDVKFIRVFNNTFGKQNLIGFQEMCFDVALNRNGIEGFPFREGTNFNLIPPDNTFCLIDLFNLLISEGNKWYPDHPEFNYKRIGAKAVQASKMLSEAEQGRIDEIINLLEKETDSTKIRELSEEMIYIKTSKKDLTFTKNENMLGYPLTSLTWNKNRANLSVDVCYQGTVNIPENKLNLPVNFPTCIFRKYALVKDGIVNVKVLPVSVNQETYNKLYMEGLIVDGYSSDKIYLLDLTKLPVINRSMFKELSAKETFNQVFELFKMQAYQKVFKYLEEINNLKQRSIGLINKYGLEASEYLATLDITDNGFSPKTTSQKAGETYQAVELNFKIKGGTLGSVDAMLTKIKEGKKLNLGDILMNEAYKNYTDFISTPTVINAESKETIISSYIQSETKSIINKTRAINKELSKSKFVVIVGKTWFHDLVDKDTLEIDTNYGQVQITAETKNTEVEI